MNRRAASSPPRAVRRASAVHSTYLTEYAPPATSFLHARQDQMPTTARFTVSLPAQQEAATEGTRKRGTADGQRSGGRRGARQAASSSSNSSHDDRSGMIQHQMGATTKEETQHRRSGAGAKQSGGEKREHGDARRQHRSAAVRVPRSWHSPHLLSSSVAWCALTAEGACVLGMLRNFDLLDLLTKRRSVAGSVLADDSDLLGATAHGECEWGVVAERDTDAMTGGRRKP